MKKLLATLGVALLLHGSPAKAQRQPVGGQGETVVLSDLFGTHRLTLTRGVGRIGRLPLSDSQGLIELSMSEVVGKPTNRSVYVVIDGRAVPITVTAPETVHFVDDEIFLVGFLCYQTADRATTRLCTSIGETRSGDVLVCRLRPRVVDRPDGTRRGRVTRETCSFAPLVRAKQSVARR